MRFGLRPGVKYQTRQELFARSDVHHVLDKYEYVEVKWLALEPGQRGVYVCDSGEYIFVRYEDDIRG